MRSKTEMNPFERCVNLLTMILSESMIVFNRWAIVKTVHAWNCWRIVVCISESVLQRNKNYNTSSTAICKTVALERCVVPAIFVGNYVASTCQHKAGKLSTPKIDRLNNYTALVFIFTKWQQQNRKQPEIIAKQQSHGAKHIYGHSCIKQYGSLQCRYCNILSFNK